MIDSIDDAFNKRQYEAHIQDYLNINQDEHVGGGTAQTRTTIIKAHIPKNARIFEIGSGGGTDAIALQEAGFDVTASDYSEKFVEVLKSKHLTAIAFDAKRDEFPRDFDLVYANAVFVHFSPEEVMDFLARAKDRLVNDKTVFFSVIQGEGRERRGIKSGLERDFQYFSQAQLKQLLERGGYQIIEINLVDDRWIQVIARVA